MTSGRPRLDVQFNEKKPVYRSGRELTGTVTVDCHGGHIHATRLFVECLGFTEMHESSHSSQKKLRRDHLSLKQNLLPANQVLESRRFDFKFRLPTGLPHSVECDDIGFVRYCCRALVCLDSNSSDWVETVGYFSLIEEVDLNSQLVLQACRPGEQASASTVERIGGRSSKDEVKASLVLAKSAFVPGENVECTLSVHSATCSILAKQATIRLVQAFGVIGESGRIASTGRSHIIVQDQVNADEQYSKHYWSARCQLHIPGVVATTLRGENSHHLLLSVQYAIEMSISLAFASLPVNEVIVSCPVVVGTVPLQDAVRKLHPAAVEASFVEVSRCVISETDHGVKERQSRSSSLIGQLIMTQNRRQSNYRMSHPIQYTLYCIYYPIISLIRKQNGLKSILKRHSVDNSLDVAGGSSSRDQEQLQVTDRKTSTSWYETPL